MDSNTAMKFVTEYTSRIERIRYVESMIKAQEELIKEEQERLNLAQNRLAYLRVELAKETAHRDDAHAFALSAIKSLTPQRGFTV